MFGNKKIFHPNRLRASSAFAKTGLTRESIAADSWLESSAHAGRIPDYGE
jgi:hypothetical protein